MKPSKNRVMCPDCGRQKMLFETERKANDFIKWNGDDLYVPEGCELRAYYCPSCCGYHISHHEHRESYDKRTDNLLNAYNKVKKGKGKIDKLIHKEIEPPMDYDKEARMLFDEIPDEVKMKHSKKAISRWMTEYFANTEKKDDGTLRNKVYQLFWKWMFEQYHQN